MASTFSASGSTQNPFSARGSLPQVTNSKIPFVTLTTVTAATITSDQSGTLFLLPSVGAIITLPTPASAGAGFNVRFQMLATNATTAWVINSGTASTIYGSVTNSPGVTTFAQIQKSGATSVTFSNSAAIGDYVNLICDGTNYIVSGYSFVTAGLA